jgi:hypothetical protein
MLYVLIYISLKPSDRRGTPTNTGSSSHARWCCGTMSGLDSRFCTLGYPGRRGPFMEPERNCDVVMKGGITSGIVYPEAIHELSRRYRFRSVGGTSAGALKASIRRMRVGLPRAATKLW